MSDTTATHPPPEPPPEEPPDQKTIKFPTAFTVLAVVLAAVWVASFLIPSGAYQTNPDTGGPEPGTYQELPSCDAAGSWRSSW